MLVRDKKANISDSKIDRSSNLLIFALIVMLSVNVSQI